MVKDEVTLLVNSCDKYQSAWFPFFELLKINWQDRPEKIVLNTEHLTYSHSGLNIVIVNQKTDEITWSQRLIDCLNSIDTDYIIFSLEDFFIQRPVRAEIVENCLCEMKSNPEIACFRLKASNDPNLVVTRGDDFRLATADVPYRLDTQFALWNKKILLSFINPQESPWEFEGKGSARILGTDKLFYWYYASDPEVVSDELIVPYVIGHFTGYGIQWGRWLYNNESLFLKYGITVDYSALGGIMKKSEVDRRMKTIYNPDAKGIDLIVKIFWGGYLKIKHGFDIVRQRGIRALLLFIKSKGKR